MPLSFQNSSGATVYVALLTYDSTCGPSDKWRKSGWYAIANGSASMLIGGDLRTLNQYIGWYADQYAGGPEWPGSGNSWYDVTNSGFDQCYDDNTGCDVSYSFNGDFDFENEYGCTIILEAPGKWSAFYYGPPPPESPPPPPPPAADDDGWGDDDDDDG